jgi:hypothetical protein
MRAMGSLRLRFFGGGSFLREVKGKADNFSVKLITNHYP